MSSEIAQDRRAWNASVRDVVNAIGDAGSTRPGWMPTQAQVRNGSFNTIVYQSSVIHFKSNNSYFGIEADSYPTKASLNKLEEKNIAAPWISIVSFKYYQVYFEGKKYVSIMAMLLKRLLHLSSLLSPKSLQLIIKRKKLLPSDAISHRLTYLPMHAYVTLPPSV